MTLADKKHGMNVEYDFFYKLSEYFIQYLLVTNKYQQAWKILIFAGILPTSFLYLATL